MKQTLLIGCGNIGFRHLQALCASHMAADLDLTIVEPNKDHHDRIAQELARTPLGQSRLLTALLTPRGRFDLAIIATKADVRRRVFDDLARQHDFAAIIFEKVLFQSCADLDAVATQLDGIAAYVNCGRRGFPGYQALRKRLSGSGPVDYTVTGAQYALASNAIHFLDIAACVNESPLISLDTTGLDTETTASKRAGYVEVYGTLTGTLANGAVVSLTCARGDSLAIDVHLSGAGVDIAVDEAANLMVSNGVTEPFETRHVSGMPYLYETLLQGKGCLLPTYAESAAQHRLLISALNAHLHLPDHPDTVCPIS